MTGTDLRQRLGAALGRTVAKMTPLSGGDIAPVFRLDFSAGEPLVAKTGTGLDIEAAMLKYLGARSDFPVPEVVHSQADLLVMTWIDNDGGAPDPAAEAHAADLVAALHNVSAPEYGFESATLIGGLAQPNPWTPSWRAFFRDHRLLYMAGEAHRAGRLPTATATRIERLAARLDTWIANAGPPALIHGDLWGGNVLSKADCIAGFVDPAIYYADAEIELAFSTLFSTFGNVFFGRYAEHRPIAPGFFEERRDLYNLYPLLVHVRLFGGGYVGRVDSTLAKFGV
ncbi:MAG TPA: fructosamine kinase family protein [Alphaproteobacteria bacterium]|nr:fructosamine kinase family protein [Alphaproteobacteria bacterium]